MNVLGLDLGTNSVGWAIVDAENERILGAGAYVFPEAGEIDAGMYETHRHKRGMKKRQRRSLRRKRQRRDELVRILVAHDMAPASTGERAELYCSRADVYGNPLDPYALRKKGLDERLSLHEFGRALFHIARRRGYLNVALLKLKHLAVTRSFAETAVAAQKAEPADGGSEDKGKNADREGPVVQRVARVRRQLEESGARTIGEFYADNLATRTPIRGAGPAKLAKLKEKGIVRDPLGLRADRMLFEEEFHLLWDKQSVFHAGVLTVSLKAEVYNAIFWQRPLSRQEHLVGNCDIFPGRKRAPMASLIFQRSRILQYLNTLTLLDLTTGEMRRLSGDEVVRIAAQLERQASLTWNHARSAAGLPNTVRFSDEPDDRGRAARGRDGSRRARTNIRGNDVGARMRNAIGAKWDHLSAEQRESLVERLTTCREFRNIVPGLQRQYGLSDAEIYSLATMELPQGHGNHCVRVLRDLEQHLRAGLNYHEAMVAAGFRSDNESIEPSVEKPLLHLSRPRDLRNPIVQRSVEAAFKVINAVIDKYGKPDKIRIELPRDVARTNADRERMYEAQDKNARENERAARRLADNGFPLGHNNVNVRKVRLWWEADGRCPYFPDIAVTLGMLVNDYDIDHIVPRSRSYDDSWTNLTICPVFENQSVKGNKTPYEAYADRWGQIEALVSRLRTMSPRKRDRILKKEWDEAEFTNRALSDTRFISRAVHTEVKKLGVPVEVSRGQLTSELRGAWEMGAVVPLTAEQHDKMQAWHARRLKKVDKPRFDHRHHAVDAIITACVDIGTLQRMTDWYKQRERGMHRRDIDRPKPWPSFTADAKAVIDRCLVVHAPTRGVAGPLHEETARKPPPKESVDAALSALPAAQRARVRRCVVVGKQLVFLAPNGDPTKAYDLGSNHHAVIWEPIGTVTGSKTPVREMEVVTMLEASRREEAGEPVFQDTSRRFPGYRAVMHLCENDIVEWAGERAGFKRVATRTLYPDGRPYLLLRPLTDARADPHSQTLITSRPGLSLLVRRISLNPIGDVIHRQPIIGE